MNARVRTIGINILLCTFSTLLSLEIGLRILGTRSDTLHNILWLPSDYGRADTIAELMELAPVKLHMHRWAGMDMTENGFRTPPYSQKKTEGTLRMLALGDSFTFSSGGVPYEDMWHALTAGALANALGIPIENINLGKPSVGPGFSNRVLELEGRNLEPDIVLFGLFIGNDLHDEAKKNWLPLRLSYSLRLLKEQRRLRESLHTISNELKNGMEEMQHAITAETYVYTPEHPSFSEDTFLRIEREKMYLFEKEKQTYVNSLIADILPALEQMKETADSAGALFAVVVMPEEMQVDAKVRAQVSGTRQRVSENYDFEWVQNTVVDLLRKQNIMAIDVLPALRTTAKTGAVYSNRNTHWNAEGNRIASQQITAQLLPLLAERKLSQLPVVE
ncbi:hypothetical protein COU78_01835 [Candidatus Peregrinibacteria bacterium CG10_big_fil_rev_8_21_14_0_10_49_24]|nr:MAG: hypothetical protein COV83_05945 [Candidatus Peregrinibacteria bacterium CG11_big_fil_rev_8_21_14_0_20_49_14]PIR51308.1 MAG: hypothetical protein COU78_01835 [Candidatus Peregrinibacteria bacterium CG10_big_fil_rev_8_21_14_0_10_49_24]PJA67413.1 MAG: hypothetical protein CO157_04685 [Candidatus Peregrinibacteria bacterium CG_4_9_14_3_um_filter_49_12]